MKLKKNSSTFTTLNDLELRKIFGGETSLPTEEDSTRDTPKTGKPITIK